MGKVRRQVPLRY